MYWFLGIFLRHCFGLILQRFEDKCCITERKLSMKPSLATMHFLRAFLKFWGAFGRLFWAFLGHFLTLFSGYLGPILGLTFEDKCCITDRKLSMKPSPATIRSLTWICWRFTLRTKTSWIKFRAASREELLTKIEWINL